MWTNYQWEIFSILRIIYITSFYCNTTASVSKNFFWLICVYSWLLCSFVINSFYNFQPILTNRQICLKQRSMWKRNLTKRQAFLQNHESMSKSTCKVSPNLTLKVSEWKTRGLRRWWLLNMILGCEHRHSYSFWIGSYSRYWLNTA
jgi:hypothetical protein